MAKIYVKKELGTKVQQLRHYFDVVTASDKGIIMMTRDDWDKVKKYISKIDQEMTNKGVELDFLECRSLWSDCFWVCCYNDENDSFWAIAHHDMFIRVCRVCKVQPILLETNFSIPLMLYHDVWGAKPGIRFNFEIEVEDN